MSELQAVVDRFEGEVAILVLAGGEILEFPRSSLPRRLHEGDYLSMTMDNGHLIRARIDHQATGQAKKRIAAKLDQLRSGAHLASVDPDIDSD